ncbi:SAM-dependent methyltransferase [Pseudooceanicola nitratireducens]|uniref:SAM-dependent methyltransferase n=1 Tax=Pseudooceanicola nitratireducens TaxID=517719 RepID=UPI001C94BAAA|nr:SAM-dependent methyltransferase [Pseudooceanicola nitratireducens]MBY6164225.1 SAM-dependent methyltransferase [Pseudooceanicola nitratireducens]
MTQSAPPRLTDRTALARNRARTRDEALFLHDLAIEDIQDRLAMVNRSFTDAAIVTGHPDKWANALGTSARIIPDDEVLELTPGAQDLVIHAMALHWADDPLGQIIQCARALRPDGLFLAVFPGGQTLSELRAALAQAEAEVTGGLSPRVAPMAEIRDMGGLLQRAGLALPVADGHPFTATYPSALQLMRELRHMGEGNALAGRLRHPTRPRVLLRAAEIYAEAYGDPATDHRIPATFDLVTLTGWSPDDSQPKPLRPGSATTRLADALNARDLPLKD